MSRYASSPGNTADCYAELAVSLLAVAETIAITYCTIPTEGRSGRVGTSGMENTGMADPAKGGHQSQ